MNRVLQPELLDELPADDPRAIHSRRDLRRINALMANAALIRNFLRSGTSRSNLTIAELGAGDGNIAITVATGLINFTGELFLIDQQPCVSPSSIEIAKRSGWSVHVIQGDVFDWFQNAQRVDVIIANLFLHHFEHARLREMFRLCASHTDCFVAAEPRRSALALWFARRIGLIGCNEVTRHDADISVRAGFANNELSELWPQGKWQLTERKAGLFTHFFAGVREP